MLRFLLPPLGAALALAAPLAAAPTRQGLGGASWKRGEGYGVLVERGPTGSAPTGRHLVCFQSVRGARSGQDLLVLAFDTASGATVGAYRLELREGSRQPERLQPLAVQLDANRTILRAEPEGPALPCEPESGAEGFSIVDAPAVGGRAWIPYWVPAMNGSDPVSRAAGARVDLSGSAPARRRLRQSWRRDDHGNLVVAFRGEAGEPTLFGTAHFKPNDPLPLFGQILDEERGEYLRFRLVLHAADLVKAMSLGRGAVAGDPVTIPPEALLDAESVWQPGVRDLVAEEVLRAVVAERHWSRVDARPSLPIGELVPFAYELFGLAGSISTGERAPDPKKTRSTTPQRGAVGLLFAGRFEVPETGGRVEAWLVPGSDERSQENERGSSPAESPGKLLLRFVLGRAANGLLPDRGLTVQLPEGWLARAGAAPPRAAPRLDALRRGTDAILLRRELDLAPVALVFYRLSDDLRAPHVVGSIALDGVGPVSAVRRSLLERAKDFFLAGGFTAFTQRKGASLLLTRGPEDTTILDRLAERGCSLEFLEEAELPEEPWKLPMDPRAARSTWWGTPMAFAVGRNRHGDQRPPRDAIVRRTDSEELLAYEAWELDRPWWSGAIAAYPLQNVGVRFRPLVHARIEPNDPPGELPPFLPPPPPPSPNANPTTPAPKPNPKTQPRPEPAKKPTPPPPPPPAPGSGPKTGG